MQRTLLIFSIAVLLCMIGLAAPAAAAGTVGGVQLVDLAVPFIENQGQLPDEVRYYANTFYGTAYVTDTDLTHAVTVGTEDGTQGVALKERFLNRAGSAISFTPSGEEPADTQASYFIGNDPAGWQTGLATYNLVSLGEIYPGITVKAKARSVNIEKLFYVAPGAAPDEIRIEILGAESLRLADDGSLVVVTGAGEVSLTAPEAFQDGHGVAVAYRVLGDDTYGFEVGEYDTGRALLIDPTLAYSSHLGGSDRDYGESIAVDGSGNAYIGGYTKSSDFPVTAGAIQAIKAGSSSSYDAFVAKVNADGTGLSYCTYLGGTGKENCYGIAVDGDGNAYITGSTGSSDFPATVGVFQTANAGGSDVFVTKINSSGTGLVYSTYLGGAGADTGYGIAVDGDGNAYITGSTGSSDFPVTAGVFQTANAGGSDVFVTKMNSNGTNPVYSTYLGGIGGTEQGSGIAVDGSGNAYVGGYTLSADFPVTTGTVQSTYGGGMYDGFVTKVSPDGSQLTYSSYFGGSESDQVNGIAVDSAGTAYITGQTNSDNIPVTDGAFQATRNSPDNAEAFVARILQDGSGLLYSTYLGGSGADGASSIDVDGAGNAYVVGQTNSNNFPVTGDAFQTAHAGSYDAFVAGINSDGSTLNYATYFGGSSGNDYGQSIAMDDSGNLYVAGYTTSSVPVTDGAFQASSGGSYDAFVAKFSGSAPVLTTIEVSPATANLAVDATQQFAAVAKDQNDDEMTGVTFDWSSSNETAGTVNATGYFTALAAGTTTVTAAAGSVTGTAEVTVTPAAQIDLNITGVVNPYPGVAVFAREPNTVQVRGIKNAGTDTATNIVVALYVSDVSEGTVPVNTTTIESLAGGAQIAITTIVDPTIRNLQGGTVRYTAIVDPDNLIAETDEANNVKVGFAAKPVLYNGYKGKMYWEGGSNVTTVRTYDLRGDIIHSFGDSQYMSGSFGSEGWTNYTVTWTAGDLPLPEGAAVHDAWLYVPYCWDNTNSAPDNVSIDFNGVRIPYVNWYNDVSNFGAYADHYYGLLTYNVTDLYQTGANNTALFARTDTNAKISPAGFTLAVIYEDPSATRKQIFINEEFDILGADEGNYGTSMAEATAYVPFTGMTIDTGNVARANLTTFVPWGAGPEGNLFFNGEQIGTQVWSHGGSGATGEADGTQVGVDEREVTAYLNATGNEAAIQSDDTWKSPVMVAGLTFLVVEYADELIAPVANFTATPLNGLAPLAVTFTDTSTNSPTTWSWESRLSGTDENWTAFSTDKNPTHTFEAGAYDIRLTATNANGNDTVTKTQYISSSAGAKRLATVQSGMVSGDLYVGAYGEFSSGISGATNTLNQTFTLPAYTDIQWARLYTVVYAAGTDNRAGTVTVRFDGNGTYETLGIETLATAGDGAVNVYPVNDHVNRQYSDYLLWYDVTDRIDSQNPKAEVVATPVASNFDGRIKELVLVVAYNDGDGDEVHYWVNDGHDYQANGADGVTSTFTTGGLTTGWTDATLRNVMLSSKDALYTFNGAAYAGANSTISFGTNTWDVRNNLTAGSDSNFTYVPNGGSYKTTLATLAVKYPEAPLPSAPVANFTANVTAGDAPLTVQFNDTSTGSPTSWAWDFEDNGTVDSTEQDPVWTYAAAGIYTVNLTVTNAADSDSEIKTGYITVSGGSPGGEAPVAAFTATPLNGLAPLAVTFADASTNSPTAWSWESRLSGTTENWTAFSTDKNPTHTFAAGAYDVCLIVSNAYGSDTVTKTQYISSSAGAKRLATVQSGTVSGDLYVGAYGGFGSGISYATNTFNQTFTLPAYTDIQWARLYTVVYAAGTDNRAGTATVRFDGNGTYATLGAETLATAGDNMANVYPVNDHVNRQYSDYLLWYDVTDLIGSEDPKAEVVATPVAPNFDGRIKELVLVVAYNDGDGDEVHYWVNEGHDWQANGAGGVTSTFATGGLTTGWTDATLRNVMLSSKDALYTFNGADYTGADSMITFGTNTWDVRNNLTAGSDSNFTYVPNGGSYKTTLATLAVKYPEAPLPSAPVANFTANVTAGDAPLTVQFNDTSIGSPTSWLWDFGDNTTSDQQHPVHTYTTAGTYSVNLTVTNAAGSDSEVKTGCITVSDPAGGDAPDLAASTLSSNNGEVFSASENTYTATITNIGTGDAGAFDVKFNVSGAAGTVAVDALATGAGTTVTWTDETIRNAGDIVTITVTADPDGLIAESNEENNLASIEKTVVHNGYRGMRWTDGGDIATAVTYDIRGDFLWSAGDGAYLSASTYPNWTTYTVNWTATDLSVPAGATIAGARLYVPYTWDKGPIFPEDVTLTFNGETVDRSAFYEDEKMWGSSYPYGMTVYDVTDAFSAAGNTAVLTNTFPGGGNVSIRGMLLAVVYDDGTTAPHTIFMNEGFDLLYGGEAQGTTPEQATAYAPFFGVETDDALSAALITVAPGAGPARGDLLINDERLADVWSFTGTSQIGVDERDVTALLRTGENLVGFQSSADYMEAAAAFLVLEYPTLPGSILVTSTPAGAAVWLDDEDTGEVTPITLEDVPAGDHVVTLKLDGYADASKSVTVVSDETVTVDLELTTLTGSLEVTSTPEGAAILIDGADTGEVTNATLDGIGAGEHTITLRKAGYADAVAEVTIAENETTTLHLDLIEAPGSIAVVSMPEGAAIFLDGADTGKLTNALLENVAAGEHTVTVKLAGYIDASRTVTVTDNETITINFLLTEPAGSIAVTSTPDGARIFLDGTDTGEVTNATLMNVAVGKHTIRLEIDDYLDVEEIVTVTSGEIASVHFTLDASAITLQPGWNFVSTPKRLADGSNTIAVFDGVDTNGRPVLFYNGTCQWEDLSREDAFRPLDGIWIYSNGTYEIPLSFAAASTSPPPTKYLDAGWNAIGFSDTVPEPAVTTLRSVETAWANLFGWKAREQAYDDSIIRGATGKHGEMRELSPFQGYWLYMNNADTLAAIGA